MHRGRVSTFNISQGDRNGTKNGEVTLVHVRNCRGSDRYWIACEIWSPTVFSEPARSAMVRGTFNARSYARAQVQIRHGELDEFERGFVQDAKLLDLAAAQVTATLRTGSHNGRLTGG